RSTLALPSVAQRVQRNLDFIRDKDLILDFNLRGFHKGEEQYPCREILLEALRLGIAVVPGDDSHGVASVGKHFERGLEVLRELGAPLQGRKAARIRYCVIAWPPPALPGSCPRCCHPSRAPRRGRRLRRGTAGRPTAGSPGFPA